MNYAYYLRVEHLSDADRQELDEALNGPNRARRAELAARMGGDVRHAG